MKKKGSLDLSINAIVILVLAITMLGLGLAFTKGMFSKFSQKLSVPEPNIPATADEPIVLPTDTLDIIKNKEFIFSVNTYNDNYVGKVAGALDCPSDTASGAGPISVTSSPQDIAAGSQAGFKFIITAKDVTTTSTRVCSLNFKGDGTNTGSQTKQIVVAIK